MAVNIKIKILTHKTNTIVNMAQDKVPSPQSKKDIKDKDPCPDNKKRNNNQNITVKEKPKPKDGKIKCQPQKDLQAQNNNFSKINHFLNNNNTLLIQRMKKWIMKQFLEKKPD